MPISANLAIFKILSTFIFVGLNLCPLPLKIKRQARAILNVLMRDQSVFFQILRPLTMVLIGVYSHLGQEISR